MTDNELLLTISNLLDQKLERLEKKIDILEFKIDSMEIRLNLRIDAEKELLNSKIDAITQKCPK